MCITCVQIISDVHIYICILITPFELEVQPPTLSGFPQGVMLGGEAIVNSIFGCESSLADAMLAKAAQQPFPFDDVVGHSELQISSAASSPVLDDSAVGVNRCQTQQTKQ
jgi:hypothetical protein